MRDVLEFTAYLLVALFNLGGALSWLHLWRANGSRAIYPALAMSLALAIVSVAVVVSHGFYTFDRTHVVEAGRWLRPTVGAGLLLAGLTQLWWRRLR